MIKSDNLEDSQNREMNNNYFILRHGQAISNIENIISCWPEKFYNPLTEEGKRQVKKTAEELLKNKDKIDLIFSSDILRAKETAEIVGQTLGLEPKYDERLREYNVGEFNNRKIDEFKNFLPRSINRFKDKPPEGESYSEIRKRVASFLSDLEKKYSGKNILIVSHQLPLVLLEGQLEGLSDEEIFHKYLGENEKRIKNGEWRQVFPINK